MNRRAADGVVSLFYTSHLPTCPFDEDILLYKIFENSGVSDDGSRLIGLRPLEERRACKDHGPANTDIGEETYPRYLRGNESETKHTVPIQYECFFSHR